MQGFDNERDRNIGKYLTGNEIEEIVNNALSKNSVSFLIGIIVAGFVIFKVLDNTVVTTKENIELKAQVEKLQLDLHKCKNEKCKNKK